MKKHNITPVNEEKLSLTSNQIFAQSLRDRLADQRRLQQDARTYRMDEEEKLKDDYSEIDKQLRGTLIKQQSEPSVVKRSASSKSSLAVKPINRQKPIQPKQVKKVLTNTAKVKQELPVVSTTKQNPIKINTVAVTTQNNKNTVVAKDSIDTVIKPVTNQKPTQKPNTTKQKTNVVKVLPKTNNNLVKNKSVLSKNVLPNTERTKGVSLNFGINTLVDRDKQNRDQIQLFVKSMNYKERPVLSKQLTKENKIVLNKQLTNQLKNNVYYSKDSVKNFINNLEKRDKQIAQGKQSGGILPVKHNQKQLGELKSVGKQKSNNDVNSNMQTSTGVLVYTSEFKIPKIKYQSNDDWKSVFPEVNNMVERLRKEHNITQLESGDSKNTNLEAIQDHKKRFNIKEPYWYVDKQTNKAMYFDGNISFYRPVYVYNVATGMDKHDLDTYQYWDADYKRLRDNHLTSSGAGVYVIDKIDKSSVYGTARSGKWANKYNKIGEPLARLRGLEHGRAVGMALHAAPSKKLNKQLKLPSDQRYTTHGCIRFEAGELRKAYDEGRLFQGDTVYVSPHDKDSYMYEHRGRIKMYHPISKDTYKKIIKQNGKSKNKKPNMYNSVLLNGTPFHRL